jgi:hypothetical protein
MNDAMVSLIWMVSFVIVLVGCLAVGIQTIKVVWMMILSAVREIHKAQGEERDERIKDSADTYIGR